MYPKSQIIESDCGLRRSGMSDGILGSYSGRVEETCSRCRVRDEPNNIEERKLDGESLS